MKITVKVDEKLCIGSGSCVVVASENFVLNSKGKAQVKASEKAKAKGSELVLDVQPGQKAKLLEAARACPAQAIILMDDKGKRL